MQSTLKRQVKITQYNTGVTVSDLEDSILYKCNSVKCAETYCIEHKDKYNLVKLKQIRL